MSDKINRKSGAERRQDQYVRETREKKKLRRTTIVIIIALALLFGGARLINSDYIRRNTTAVSVGSLKFSPAEFNYFYYNAYTEYQNFVYENFYDIASQLLPVSGKPLKSQINSETGDTWDEYFKNSALTRMSEVAAVYDEATAAGFTIPEDKRIEMEEYFDTLKASAEMYGYGTVTKYLEQMYGKTVTEDVMRRLAEIEYTVAAYGEYTRNSFTYSNDDLSAYYEENKDKLDTFSYRYFHVQSESVNESDYATAEEYEQAKADAIAEAVRQGEEIAASIKSEQDFIDAARAYDSETYALDDSTLRHYKGEILGDVQGTWLRDAARKSGDVAPVEFTNGCYVQYFINRSSNDYNIVNLRQLVITPKSVSASDYPEGEEDVAYTAAVAQAKADAKDTAELVLAALQESGGTEARFIELIAEYSSDTAEGGLYENVYRHETENRFPQLVNEWPFIETRTVGDFELISQEDGTQYVLFLSSIGELYRDYLADTAMRDRDYSAWEEALVIPAAKTHWSYVLAD